MPDLVRILEAILFVATHPVSPRALQQLLQEGGFKLSLEPEDRVADVSSPDPEKNQSACDDEAASESAAIERELQAAQQMQAREVSAGEIKRALRALGSLYNNDPSRGIELVELGGAYQLRTRPEVAEWIRLFLKPPQERFSQPALESLAIVAYRQPISRIEIEEIRGVDSGGVLKTLLDKKLVRLVGRSDDPGRPLLYGTTPRFLEFFGLESLRDLPTLKDLARGALAQGTVAAAANSPLPVAFPDIDPILPMEQGLAAEEAKDHALMVELESQIKGLTRLERQVLQQQELAASPDSALPPAGEDIAGAAQNNPTALAHDHDS